MKINESAVIFIIVAFCAAAVLVMKRGSIPAPMRRWVAIIALAMIVLAFVLLVQALLNMGT